MNTIIKNTFYENEPDEFFFQTLETGALLYLDLASGMLDCFTTELESHFYNEVDDFYHHNYNDTFNCAVYNMMQSYKLGYLINRPHQLISIYDIRIIK